jgi:hypothetical protein
MTPGRNWKNGVVREGLVWILQQLHTRTTRGLRRLQYREWHSRHWSNEELRRWAPLLPGDIINVSGWMDGDKEGGTYSDYFTAKRSYVVSNVSGARGSEDPSALRIDLTEDTPPGLRGGFDTVFCHTVLEHVFDIRNAVRVLCALSRDLVIVVVPFSQQVHYDEGSYLDYWRPTPFALTELFKENRLSVVYWSSNPNTVYPTYLFMIASHEPERWRSAAASVRNQWTERMP